MTDVLLTGTLGFRTSSNLSIRHLLGENIRLSKIERVYFSAIPGKVKDEAVLIEGNVKIEVENIQNETGKDICIFGGAGLTPSLINSGLVDELSLAVHSVLLLAENQCSIISMIKYADANKPRTYSTGHVSLLTISYRNNK